MAVLVVSAAATSAMTGLIWTIQVVHYPMLADFSRVEPVRAATDHQRRITPVVGPLMAAEGITALILLVEQPATMSVAAAWGAAALLGVALVSTVVLQVPLHRRLAQGHDADAAERLVSTNWVRTFAWTARGTLLAVVLAT